MRKKVWIGVSLILVIVVILLMHKREGNATQPVINECSTDSIVPDFYSKLPEEGLMEALNHYGIRYPEIVYAQAQLETGYFTSRLCTEYNNIFGIYNSSRKRYERYNHWTECVKDYKNKIQYRYKENEDYYRFLKRINYASDPKYIVKLKYLVKENDKINKDSSPSSNQQVGQGSQEPSPDPY